MAAKEKATPPNNVGPSGEMASNQQAQYNQPPNKPVDPNEELKSSVIKAQCAALFQWLQTEGSIDTLEARRRGVNHPAGRINNLQRDQNVPIETPWTDAIDQKGKVVRVARYVLLRNPQQRLPGMEVKNA